MHVFGVSDTSSPPHGLGAVTASTRGRERVYYYAKRSGFLRFYDAVHVPSLPRRLPVRHIAHCTHKVGTHFLESDSRPLPRSCACSIFPAHRPSHWREGAHKRDWPPIPLSQDGFLREATPFFKGVSRPPSKGLFHCISSIGLEAPKVNNQF